MERFIQANVFVSRRAMADVMAGQRAVGFLHMYIHVASVAGGPRGERRERRAASEHGGHGAARLVSGRRNQKLTHEAFSIDYGHSATATRLIGLLKFSMKGEILLHGELIRKLTCTIFS